MKSLLRTLLPAIADICVGPMASTDLDPQWTQWTIFPWQCHGIGRHWIYKENDRERQCCCGRQLTAVDGKWTDSSPTDVALYVC
jgi:hypothetical protein